jgi:hypothetical protein
MAPADAKNTSRRQPTRRDDPVMDILNEGMAVGD